MTHIERLTGAQCFICHVHVLVTWYFFLFQKKYLLKFSTDGAVLTKSAGAVQGTVRVFDVDDNWHPVRESKLPKEFQDEILIYYYVGMLKTNLRC